MIAIHTKCLPATNSRGTRIKAYTTTGLFVVIPYPYELSFELCHFEAVKELIKKYKLECDSKDMRYGDSADGKGYVFCFNHSIVIENFVANHNLIKPYKGY